jgi:hypothetical protein
MFRLKNITNRPRCRRLTRVRKTRSCASCWEVGKVKTCNKCGKTLPATDEYFPNCKGKLVGPCKDCRQQEYLANREKRVQQSREYYRNNKQQCLKLNKEYRKNNSEWYRDYNKQYYLENTDKIKSSAKKSLQKRMNEDEGFLILQRCRKRAYDALKGYVKSARTRQLLGCSADTLREHIEQQFENGMTWGNYGKWHVDHIMPCALFDFTKKEDQQKCFHCTNLQPLWASENLSKSDKVDGISCRSMGVV